MKLIKVLIFDCDGVLFDTRQANTAYYNDILAHFGRPAMRPDQFEYTQMHTADEAIVYLFEDAQSISAAQEFRKKSGYDPYIKYMEMDPDLISVLEKYKGDYHLAVATNRSDTMGKVLVEHGLKQYFDLVVTALDVDRPKPYPDPLLKVIDYFAVAPDETIYVGDSKLDELASKAAGVPFIAYRNPLLAADFHIQRLREITSILNHSRG